MGKHSSSSIDRSHPAPEKNEERPPTGSTRPRAAQKRLTAPAERTATPSRPIRLPQKRESPGIRGFQLITWCGRRDSNSHTLRRQNLNLVCLPISPRPPSGVSNENARQRLAFSGIWGGRRGSNPRHQEPQSCALPTELRPPYFTLLVPEPEMAHPAGLEPATIRLEGGCSIQLSYGRSYLHSVRSADLKLRP